MRFTPNGIYTAIVTPFDAKGEFDEPAFRKLVDFQIQSGVAGLLVVGGSGEYVSLTLAERKRVVDVALDQSKRRLPIIVGALSPSTKEVIEISKYADEVKADAVLVLPPYYIKPSADGIVEHFAKVADSVSLPIVAYNNTGRTGLTLDIPILERLAKINSIVALKECERDLAVVASKIKAVGDRIAVMSGDDDLGFPTFLLGSPGGIFMTANLVPEFHRKLFEATMKGELVVARKAHYALLALVEALYTANHPGPLKNAMAFVGHSVGSAGVPLQNGTKENLARAEAALKAIAAVEFNYTKP